MNARFSEIKNTELSAIDGSIGEVIDLLIEDEHWMVRYLVVETTESETGHSRQILVSPAAISYCDLRARSIETELRSQQISDGPTIDVAQTVSRQHELALVEHYGWPTYWLGRTILAPQGLDALASDDPALIVDESSHSNLRSAAEICGYQIRSSNGKAGMMRDLVIKLGDWSVNNGVAESSSWLPRESSMFSTQHIESVDWHKREVVVDLRSEVLIPETAGTFSLSQFVPAVQKGFAQRSTQS